MKNMMKKTIAILAVMTIVFTAAATTCNASYTDENAENGIMPIWEHEVENSNRD